MEENMISDWMDSVESDIARISAHPYAGTPVGDVLDWAACSKGKRIRPILLILCSLYGPNCLAHKNRLTLLAAMMEVTHLASLIHDDIVDEAPFRRDRESVQRRFGKDAAVYAGDYLIARVQYYQAQENLHEAGMLLADAIQQMCAGEIGQARCRYREDVTMQEYLCNIRGKTTALLSCLLPDRRSRERLQQRGDRTARQARRIARLHVPVQGRPAGFHDR